MLEKALEANMRLRGEDHHSTLLSQNSLAGAYESIGLKEQAMHLYNRALETAVRVLGDDHPHTKIIRSNLALADAPHDHSIQDGSPTS
jgi:hypothetical protein